MQQTPYQDINSLLDSLLARLRKILGKKLLGLYLYGSLVWGDFDYDVSDIDLLAVLSADIDAAELVLLRDMHAGFAAAHAQWDDRIEVQYISAEALRTFKTKPGKMVVISLGEPLHFVRSDEQWLLNWYFVQDYGVTLFGPRPDAFIEPISKHEFIDSVRDQAFRWRDYVERTRYSRPYQAYAILTMCRTLYTLNYQEQVSKKHAALWAQKELPEYAWLIKKALEWRVGGPCQANDYEATYPMTVEFVQSVIEKIQSEGL